MPFPVACFPKMSRPGSGGGGFVGPLDDYTANLAGAWSVARRLLTSYEGSLIRIRRTSDDAEQDVGFVSNGNLNTTAITSFVGANSAYVTKIYDQNGNAQDVTQSTAANQPLIVSSGTLQTLAGLPAVVFDGTNDSLLANTLTGAGVRQYTTIMRSATAVWSNYGAPLEVSVDGDRLGIVGDATTRWDGTGLIPNVRKNGVNLTPYDYEMTTINAAMVVGVETRLSASAAVVQMAALGTGYYLNYYESELVAWGTAGVRSGFEADQIALIGL